MDDAGAPKPPPIESTPSFEVVDSNRHFMLGRDEDGYAIWRTDADDTEPIRTFPVGDQGSEDALATYQRLSRGARSWPLTAARWIAIVSAVAWALSGIGLAIVYGGFDQNEVFSSLAGWIRWIQVLQSAAYPLTVGAGVVYGVLWLDGRKGPTRA
jgi:hypothetical protein